MKARRRPPPPPQNAPVPPAANKPLAVNGGGLRSSLAHGASLGTGAAIATEAVRAVFRKAPPEEKCANIQNQMNRCVAELGDCYKLIEEYRQCMKQ